MTTNRWKDVFGTAPSILEEAKKIWSKVASRKAPAPTTQSPAAAVEQKIEHLEEEAVASFDVVRSIAQQHSQLSEQHVQLVEAVDGVLARTRALQWICGALALALLATLAMLLLLIAR